MKRFPCERIMLDAQGGGIGIIEALHDPDKFDANSGERAIWEIIEKDKEKPSDFKEGLHIVEMVQFRRSEWTHEANNGMRKDFEDRVLLFPMFDAITIAESQVKDKTQSRIYDTLENCVMEIEELKDELSTIIITQTSTGIDKWDTPEVKLPGGKKGRLRKDRYSALVMANMGARQLRRNPEIILEASMGGFAGKTRKVNSDVLYSGNEWYNAEAKKFFDAL